MLGKLENLIPYLFDKEKGWNIDDQNLLTDRLIGYDGECIGSSSMLFKIIDVSNEIEGWTIDNINHMDKINDLIKELNLSYKNFEKVNS